MIRWSVTSLGRTWPSTIFWRAVEKSDIGDPGWQAVMAAENEEKSAPSLIQGLSKRNMTTGAGADLGREFAVKRTKAPLSPAGTPRAPFQRCENHPIWSFASLGGFVIRSAQRTPSFAY